MFSLLAAGVCGFVARSVLYLLPALPDRRCTIDVYRPGPNGYEIEKQNAGFRECLEKEMGLRLIPVSNDDQLKYGTNFLCIGPNRIPAAAGSSACHRSALRGVNATWKDFSNLTGGYGAAHCCTQVLHRR